MSRSYRKVPRSGDKKDKYFKRYANKRLRRKSIDSDIPQNNKQYRKDYCYYDICDYEDVGTSFERYYQGRIKRWHMWHFYEWCQDEPYPDREECWKEYQKFYLRK